MSYSIVGGDGNTYGPYTEADIRQFHAEGRLNAQSLVHLAGEADWTPLGQRAEFSSLFAPPPAAAPAPAPAWPPPPQALPPAGGMPGWEPPPPSSSVPNPIPWEAKPRGPAVNALVETAKLFAMTPAEAWRRTPPLGDYVAPLLYSIILSWIGGFFSIVWSRLFSFSWMSMLPADARHALGSQAMLGAGMGIGTLIVYPILIAAGLFIGTAVIHVCMMMVGGLSDSKAGFEGSFRSLSYASIADLANIVPLGGGLIAAVWKTYLIVVGLSTLHRTTQGKALFAVLIPVVLCCGCIVVIGIFSAAAIGSFLSR